MNIIILCKHVNHRGHCRISAKAHRNCWHYDCAMQLAFTVFLRSRSYGYRCNCCFYTDNPLKTERYSIQNRLRGNCMNTLKRAVLYIGRKRGRTLTIFLILLVLARRDFGAYAERHWYVAGYLHQPWSGNGAVRWRAAETEKVCAGNLSQSPAPAKDRARKGRSQQGHPQENKKEKQRNRAVRDVSLYSSALLFICF